MNIKIIGQGVWGTSIYQVMRQNNPAVSFWDRHELLDNSDILVLTLPTQRIRSFLQSNKVHPKIIINTAKGIEKETHLFPYQIVQNIVHSTFDYFTLIGPSFAKEVKEKMPTLVNLGYTHQENKEMVKGLFQTEYFRLRLTEEVSLLELFGAFKNVYAIGSGIANGLGFEMNTRVKLMMIGLEELYMLADKMKLSYNKTSLVGTIGDLVLTCSSEESRNFRLGEYITHYSVEESLRLIGSTVEGLSTVDSIEYFSLKYSVPMPLARFILHSIIANNPETVRASFQRFIEQV